VILCLGQCDQANCRMKLGMSVCRVHVLWRLREWVAAGYLSRLGIVGGREMSWHIHTSIQSNRMTYKHMHRM
jgi:hypothetical protein